MPKGYGRFCVVRWICGAASGEDRERAVTKMCVVFFCVQIICASPYFSAAESAPDGTRIGSRNNTYNRRPFFCVFSALIVENDKIYTEHNKVAKKYIRIAYSAILECCCVSYCGVPPRGAASNAPYPFSKFLFFYFFGIGVYLV